MFEQLPKRVRDRTPNPRAQSFFDEHLMSRPLCRIFRENFERIFDTSRRRFAAQIGTHALV